MAKFKNKYRSESHRLPGWDYSRPAKYYLTIVTQNRECNLGQIQDRKMVLSPFGIIVKEEWLKSFIIHKELILHEYVIMPNHIHAIVEIVNPKHKKTSIKKPISERGLSRSHGCRCHRGRRFPRPWKSTSTMTTTTMRP